LANALVDDFGNRGLKIIHFIIDDGTGDGIVNWEDARKWQDGNDGAHPPLDPRITTLADPDYSAWNRIMQDCSSHPDCACNYTPQYQIIDQGGITVSDTCSIPDPDNCDPGIEICECMQCGYNDTQARKVIESILPAEWCGKATP
jgi:hypothetical protein